MGSWGLTLGLQWVETIEKSHQNFKGLFIQASSEATSLKTSLNLALVGPRRASKGLGKREIFVLSLISNLTSAQSYNLDSWHKLAWDAGGLTSRRFVLRNLSFQMVGKSFKVIAGVYTLLYLEWITNKNLLYSTGHSAQCYVAAWMGGELGREWIHVYVWPSPFVVHLKLSHH